MGSEQQFCLRWNNFQHSLLTSLPQLLDADDLTDVTLCAGGKSLKAHRVVLSACSHYFKELFREMPPFHHPVIVLPTTSYPDVCALVSFMYSGEVNIYQEQLPSLLAAAAALHIRGLAEVPTAGKISPPETPPSSKEEAAPPCKRPKLITSTPNCTTSPDSQTKQSPSTPIKNEPQNLTTSQKPSPELAGVVTARVEIQRTLGCLALPKLENPESSSPPTLDNSDPPNDSAAFGHSGTSEDSSENDHHHPEKLLLSPLNFLPASALFSPFATSLARNKLFATCHICGKSLSNQYNLRVHLETHQNLNYSCNLCSHVSRSRDALRKHIAYKHTEGKFMQQQQRKQNSSSTNSSPEDLKYNSASQQASSSC